MDQNIDRTVEDILRTFDTITVVGASQYQHKPAHYVPADMQRAGWRVIPVNPDHDRVLGAQCYPSLADVPGDVGLVNVFRRAEFTPDVVDQAIAVGAKAIWLQLGIFSSQARAKAERAGLLYVEDRCILVERRVRGLRAPVRRAG